MLFYTVHMVVDWREMTLGSLLNLYMRSKFEQNSFYCSKLPMHFVRGYCLVTRCSPTYTHMGLCFPPTEGHAGCH